MDPQPDVIHKQIEETRSSLTEKLETLEAEVKDTVESAKEAVQETFTTAKETVQDTISSVKETVHTATETVKRTFDLHYQVDQHPWGMLGLSFVGGLVGGAFLAGRMRSSRRRAVRSDETSPAAAWSRVTHDESRRPGFVDRLAAKLGGEVERIQDAAINALSGLVADVSRKAIPALKDAFEDLVARTATNTSAPQQHGEERFEEAAGTRYHTPPMY
jgi:ElaB/YqjD/DUF883 family membrane-anchored ribosome-binding protein